VLDGGCDFRQQLDSILVVVELGSFPLPFLP
jgi:hypothetical protein